MKYAQIALNLPINKTFHYRIPPAMAAGIEIGSRVWVPFGRQRLIGYIIAITNKAPLFRVKDIEKVIDKKPILSGDIMRLTKWISDYYCTSWGNAIEAAVPAPLKKGKTDIKERRRGEEEKHSPTSLLKPTLEQAKALAVIKGVLKEEI